MGFSMRLKRTRSQYRAFVSFDAMFSLIPVLMIILLTLNSAHFLTSKAMERMHQQQVFDKLVSISDYAVKQGAVRTESIGNSEARYPNWINSSKVDDDLEKKLMEKTKLKSLNIALDQPGSGVCIYRIVVVDDDKKIALLYVCGE